MYLKGDPKRRKIPGKDIEIKTQNNMSKETIK